MSKKVFVLVHDYWHHDDSIKPMMNYLFNADYEVTFTKNPNDYFNGQFDLFLSFKDPIENDQIPTPIWCDEKWTEKFLNDVQNGMGTIMFHASLTDYPENHAILTNVVRSNFITHPELCPLTVKPITELPVLFTKSWRTRRPARYRRNVPVACYAAHQRSLSLSSYNRLCRPAKAHQQRICFCGTTNSP